MFPCTRARALLYVVAAVSAAKSIELSGSEGARSSEPDETALLQVRSLVGKASSCTDAWGIFPGDPLNQSSVVASSSHGTLQDFSGFEDYDKKQAGGLFASPAHRFAFCSIPKVASSAWELIFQKLYLNNVSGAFVQGEPNFSTSRADMEAVFSDPGATTAVAVREPLSRFTSAFFNKCNFSAKGSKKFRQNCPVGNKNPSMKDAVEWMLSQDPTNVDKHWLLQSEFCDLRHRLQSFDYVIYYDKKSFGRDSACLMERAGIGNFNTKGPEYNWRAYWQDGMASCQHTKTKVSGIGTPVTSCTDQEEVAKLELLFTPKAARKLMAHLHDDYAIFNIPEPAWLLKATGLLYETPFEELDGIVG